MEIILLDFLRGFSLVLLYFLACACGALLLRCLFNVRRERFRKTLHFILLGSLLVWVFAFGSWLSSLLACLAFVALVYPLLSILERVQGYAKLLIEREKGEIKRSLLVVFAMFAVVIALCWGWLGEPWLVFACVYAWGFGDAAAALIGKKYGRHFLEGGTIEGRKSVEGTVTMFIVSFLTLLVILILSGRILLSGLLPIAFLAAAVSALVELFTPKGLDTLTCPLAAASIILPLAILWRV